ncbi:WAT1-related protein At5g40240-like [Syzygium oleosum]|uniref:WAT1-related protein At5g40240-like n=1 Tax=Syzygium oleosum TaxID=219896 RepID=UPI0011D2605C|nr:WAT1-related protein At5g40240-like [Syzygium oleosum]
MVGGGGAGLVMVLVVIEFLEQGLSTMSKAAMSRGMSNFVFVAYSNALAIFFLFSASILFYRKRRLPRLTISIALRIFLLGLIATCLQLLMYVGIGYSSPTLASVMTDLAPAFTFILALVSRMEKIDLRVQSSMAKFMGTIVCITGALTVTLYKGLPLTNVSPSMHQELLLQPHSSWIIGGFLLACAAFLLSVLLVVQTWIVRDYPAELMLTLLACVIVTIQSTIVALIVEKDVNAWMLKPDVELLTIVYAAFFVVAIRSVTYTWVCKTKGPLYISMFKPLGMIIASAMGVSLLGDTLYLGSVIGGVIIAIGFYAVIWGKAQEEKAVQESGSFSFESSSPKVPLLSKHVEA